MTTLHLDEFTIDESIVRSLLRSQAPQWASLPLERVASSGTVNVAYRLGADKVIRLPRTADFSDGPLHEARWMPALAPEVPLRVPDHLILGEPTNRYPSHWSVLEWIDGDPASVETLEDLPGAARSLGEFVGLLQGVSTTGAPEKGNYRARPLAEADAAFHTWLEQSPDDIDRGTVLDVWEACLDVGESKASPRWMHSDLRGDNLIARDGDLVAVIDWEGCSVGDPSADLLAAWWLFDASSRTVFLDSAGASPADRMRGKGWALFMAVAAIPYYETTNPLFAGQARSALREILDHG